MSNDSNAGCFAALLWIGTIGVSILSGYMAWGWIEPESFGGAILFLAAWGLLSYIGHMLFAGIVVVISKGMD